MEKVNWEKLAKNLGSKNLELEANIEELKNEKKRRELLITTLICTIDDLLPEDHWIRLGNSYRKLKSN
jgi:hypothetical protein